MSLVVHCNLVVSAFVDLLEVATAVALVAVPIEDLLALDCCSPVAAAPVVVRTCCPSLVPVHTIDPMRGVDLLHRRLLPHSLPRDEQPAMKSDEQATLVILDR